MKKLLIILAAITLFVSVYLNVPYIKAAKIVFQKIANIVSPAVKRVKQNVSAKIKN